jgi:hypothetical protein
MRSVGHVVRFKMQRNHPQVMDGLGWQISEPAFYEAIAPSDGCTDGFASRVREFANSIRPFLIHNRTASRQPAILSTWTSSAPLGCANGRPPGRNWAGEAGPSWSGLPAGCGIYVGGRGRSGCCSLCPQLPCAGIDGGGRAQDGGSPPDPAPFEGDLLIALTAGQHHRDRSSVALGKGFFSSLLGQIASMSQALIRRHSLIGKLLN